MPGDSASAHATLQQDAKELYLSGLPRPYDATALDKPHSTELCTHGQIGPVGDSDPIEVASMLNRGLKLVLLSVSPARPWHRCVPNLGRHADVSKF